MELGISLAAAVETCRAAAACGATHSGEAGVVCARLGRALGCLARLLAAPGDAATAARLAADAVRQVVGPGPSGEPPPECLRHLAGPPKLADAPHAP